jgi:hypothetical protein
MKRAAKSPRETAAPKKSRKVDKEKNDTFYEDDTGDEVGAKNGRTPAATASKKGGTSATSASLWEPASVLAAEMGLGVGVSRTVVRLLEEGNSIPFLARYRREATGGMLPDTLRDQAIETALNLCLNCTVTYLFLTDRLPYLVKLSSNRQQRLI